MSGTIIALYASSVEVQIDGIHRIHSPASLAVTGHEWKSNRERKAVQKTVIAVPVAYIVCSYNTTSLELTLTWLYLDTT